MCSYRQCIKALVFNSMMIRVILDDFLISNNKEPRVKMFNEKMSWHS